MSIHNVPYNDHACENILKKKMNSETIIMMNIILYNHIAFDCIQLNMSEGKEIKKKPTYK